MEKVNSTERAASDMLIIIMHIPLLVSLFASAPHNTQPLTPVALWQPSLFEVDQKVQSGNAPKILGVDAFTIASSQT